MWCVHVKIAQSNEQIRCLFLAKAKARSKTNPAANQRQTPSPPSHKFLARRGGSRGWSGSWFWLGGADGRLEELADVRTGEVGSRHRTEETPGETHGAFLLLVGRGLDALGRIEIVEHLVHRGIWHLALGVQSDLQGELVDGMERV